MMNFSVKNRDGPARIGEFLIEDKKIITPNVAFIHTSKLKAPKLADILITNDKLKVEKATIKIENRIFTSLNDKKISNHNYLIYPKDVSKELHPSSLNINKKTSEYCIIPACKDIIDDAIKNNNAYFFIVANAVQSFQQHSKFLEFITELREKIGYQKILYMPCIGNPTNFALLAYLGIDMFDSFSAIIAARNDILLFTTGGFNKNELSEIPCSCPICSKIKDRPSEMTYLQILHHNYYEILTELKHVRNSIHKGNLRELVEIRVRSNPKLTSILRNLDSNHYDFLEKRIPITRKSTLIATTSDALYRPEIKRFQRIILDRYKKPESTKILLLLPCSAKKPYSFSKSHKLFRERIFDLKNPNVIHEVIITSPLGVVPRELELTYPASSYDIPVTGYWYEDEKEMIRNILKQYLKNNTYDKVIIHLPAAIQDFINDIFKKSIASCIDKPTSNESLEKLYDILQETTEPYESVKTSKRSIENINSLASFQFGRKIAKILLEDCQIKGKYPYQKIFYEKKQIGMTTLERGLISLTINGAKRLKKSKKYWVEIFDDFVLKGSLFAPGVKNADESIRIGDEAVIIKNNKVCAVGVAQMNGNEMKESSKGEAVKIRHYAQI